MAEKIMLESFKKTSVPNMKLFALGELDRTPSNCIPRLCNLTVTRLQIIQPLGTDLSSVTLAVKMQNSKRILRSNEIPLLANGLLDTQLQLSFSLQYPHFLKRDVNTLQIMLQKRKKYKNRTFLGWKTLAIALVNMTQVLQRPVEREELDMFCEGKDKGSALAKVSLVSLSSQPVDTDDIRPKQTIMERVVDVEDSLDDDEYSSPDDERVVDVEDSLDDDDYSSPDDERVVDVEDSLDDDDYSSPDDGSDSDPTILDAGFQHRFRRRFNLRNQNLGARQRNFKQKFVSLLKKFKVPEALQAFDQDPDLDQRPDVEVDDAEIEDLFNELEGMSDSDAEVDTISISSTPKPSLRPYFSSSKSLLIDGIASAEKGRPTGIEAVSDESSKRDSDLVEAWTDQEQSDTQAQISSSPREEKTMSNITKFFRDASHSSLRDKKGSGGSTPRQEKTDKPAQTVKPVSDVISSNQPREAMMDNLYRILPLETSELSDHVILVNGVEPHGAVFAAYLSERHLNVLTTTSLADVRATVSHLIFKLQKYFNSNAKSTSVKILLIGSDTYINSFLRPYVELISAKPRDFQSYFTFLIIPLSGGNSIAKYLASIDSVYGASFVSDSWKDILETWEKCEIVEAGNRVHAYLNQAQCSLGLPIAEAVITYKGKNDEESHQAFIPFLTDVRLGSGDVTTSSVDFDEPTPLPADKSSSLPTSPPNVTGLQLGSNVTPEKPFRISQGETTPPPSPSITANSRQDRLQSSDSCYLDKEPLDLQIDYWVNVKITEKNKEKEKSDKSKDKDKGDKNRDKDKSDKNKQEGGKFTLKGTFRTLQVSRLAPLGVTTQQDQNSTCVTHLTFSYATKEKKQRMMRLGKKKERERESESRREVIDNICRLLASARNQTLKVTIDSVEWHDVKFFQIASQWQTQIKNFPVALFSLQ